LVCSSDDDFSFYVWIPPAPDSYMIGCSPEDSECSPNEKPAHLAKIATGFWLGRDEVRQDQFSRAMNHANPSRFKGSSLPVDSVTWEEASAFCRTYGGRLPTEEEWEYAARAGTTGARYGDPREGSINDLAWYGPNSSGTTHKAHAKVPNAWWLDDMLGNLSEWTSTDSTASCAGCKIVRGGSWSSPRKDVRVSWRRAVAPASRDSNIGFRCVGSSIRR
jgi:formylglycine-generating enzyme required for sulfatase activity